jgi:UDP-hydrolysing UDP-N-acetyl-D-glucosamine 2-epimerase
MRKFKNNILFFSGGRSEYNLIEPLLIQLKKKARLSIFITGTHISKKYGFTKKKINFIFFKKYTLKINVEINSKKNLLSNSTKIINFVSKNFNNKKINCAVIVGDRYEALSFAYALKILNIPIIHIHGGEITKNSLDDLFRFCISKMSSLHFVSHEAHERRLIKIGIEKNTIYNFGGLGASICKNKKLANKKILEKIYNFKFWKKNFIVTFHPEINIDESIKKLKNIFAACKKCKDINFLITYPNFDYGADLLIKILEKNKNEKNIKVIKNFNEDFYSVMSHCNGIIGNSSSAILEAPSFGIFTINIGERQKGRMLAKTIINTNGSTKDLIKKIIKVSKLKRLSDCNLYYKKNTFSRMANQIIKTRFSKLNFSID